MTYKFKILGTVPAVLTIMAASAAAETKSYNFTAFTEAEISAGIDAEILVGGDFSVRAEGSAEDLERLKIEKRSNALHAGMKNSFRLRAHRSDIKVYITMPSLDAVGVSSGATVKAEGIDASNFDADASSGATAHLRGACKAIEVDVSSGASVNARDLRCDEAEVDASSGASAKVFAAKSVDANASSGAGIDVYGGPETTDISKSSGGGVSIKN